MKTSGPGRNKAAIMKDVLALYEDECAVEAAPAAAAEEAPAAKAEKPAPPAAAAPAGFEWGGTF